MTSSPVPEPPCHEADRRKPFGEESCEMELERFDSEYAQRYFHAAPFNALAVDKHHYLFIGRRGAGKTSLTNFFEFQAQDAEFHQKLKGGRAASTGRPRDYFRELADLLKNVVQDRDHALEIGEDIWTYLIWQVIFTALRNEANNVQLARDCEHVHDTKTLIPSLLNQLTAQLTPIHRVITTYLASPRATGAMGTARQIARKRPLIVSLDVLEHYRPDDEGQMRALGSLVQSASSFERNTATDGLCVKAFMPAEIFPHLRERVVLNSGKDIRSPVYLHWRPKDLMRLVCWRFYQTLSVQGFLPSDLSIDWDSPRQVRETLWDPFFGTNLVNAIGREEGTVAYVLRHTQLRPRQLVRLCNQIVTKATKYPRFVAAEIVAAVAEFERELAAEVINSYSRIYPKVEDIVAALTGLPMTFRGSELDKVSKRAASTWGEGFDRTAFRKLVAELGIVGRVRRRTERGFVLADFEYFRPDRLELNERDECAIHPMFYARLSTSAQDVVVLPFPDGPEQGLDEIGGQ
jgi:hypothetical protein